MFKIVKGIFEFPDIKVREAKENLYEVTRIQTKCSFYFEGIMNIFAHGILIYFVINHWFGNFTITWVN